VRLLVLAVAACDRQDWRKIMTKTLFAGALFAGSLVVTTGVANAHRCTARDCQI
jgi:hypothetical protein